MSYKKIASAWINDSKDGNRKYLSIKNVSDEPIIIKPGENFFMNMTPKKIRDEHPGVPIFSKEIKIDDINEIDFEDSEETIEIPF